MLDDPDRSVREQASRQLSRMPTAVGLHNAFRAAKGDRRALLFAAIARRPDADTTFLVPSLADADDNIKRDAALALRNKTGTQTDVEIAKLLPSPEALDLLAARRARSQAAAVMPLINNPAISKQAFTALGLLAGEKEIGQLIAAAVASTNNVFRDQAVKAISAAGPRVTDGSRCVAALQNVPALFRPTALSLLPSFGGKPALDIVVAATKYDDADSRAAAVRAMGEWRDESAVEPLLALCRGGDEKLRVLAARGAIRVVEQADIEKAEKAALVKQVIEAAPRPEEKQQAQAALQGLDKKPEPPRRKKK
jgi:HEAT repeat protein